MEYKFRGKEIASNEWYYGDLIIDEGRYYICLQVNDHIKRDDYEVYMVEVIPETVKEEKLDGSYVYSQRFKADGYIAEAIINALQELLDTKKEEV